MRKIKSLIPTIALLILILAAGSPATQSDQLEQARSLFYKGQYEESKSIYQQVLAENPSSDNALEAEKRIVIIRIATSDQNEVDAAFEQLCEKYSKHKNFSDAVRFIGDNYLWRSKNEKARDMYNIAVADTKSPNFILAKMGLAIASINLSDLKTGEALTKQIFSDFADDDRLSMASRQIADAFRYNNHHEQAIELYQYVLDNHADSEQMMWSLRGFAISNICLRNYDAAESATQKLCENYSEHPSIYKAVQDIADNYRWKEVKQERARELYAVACEGMSGPDSIWPKMGFVITNIILSDFKTSDLWTDKIINEFTDDENLPKVIWRIADVYHHAGRYDSASALSKYLLDNFPGHKQLLWVKELMVKIDIAQGNDTSVEKSIDNLYVEFKDHPDLAEAIFDVGSKYWDIARTERNKINLKPGPNNPIPPNLRQWPILDDKIKGNYTKAHVIWERIIKELSSSSTTAQACHMVAECHRKLSQEQQAIEYYQTVVNNWPDYQYAWHCQYMIGRIYKDLKNSNTIPESDADLIIKDTFERLVENYPDCPPARSASIWLNNYQERITLQRELKDLSPSQRYYFLKNRATKGGQK